MAFGAVLGTLGINAVSITNPFTATGSVVVSVGDLVVAVLAEQTSLTVTAVTDNLGNTYTAQNAGTDAGSVAGRAFYSRVTVAGTLTGVSAACTASTDNAAFMVAVFAGPFTAPPIDANPANISNDTVTPFTCPATGVLTQAAELVVGWVAGGGSSTAYTATSPNILVANQQISSTVATAAIGSQVVAATTTVAPAFATSVPSTDVLGTMSFMQDTSIVAPPNGWFGPISTKAVVAALAIATQATNFAAPAPTNNTIKGTGWYRQLSSAAPVAKAQQGLSIVPFNIVQVTAAPNPSGWRSQSPRAVAVAQANPTQATAFAVPPQASNSVSQFGWYAPLSSPVAVAKAQTGSSFVPFNTAQTVASNPSGWQTIQSSGPKRAVINGSALTFVVPPFTVPAPPPNGWFGQINPAAKAVAAQPTQATAFAVPPQAAGASTPGQFGWYAPLSKAVPIAQAQQGSSFVPFNTAQVSTASIPVALVYDAGYPRTAVVYYQSLFSPLPPIAAPSNTVTQLAWQQPLSVAVKSRPVVHTQPVWIPTAFPTFTLAWVQPLSKAVPVVKAQQGIAFVPFNTAQVQPAGIAGMAWFMPLGTVATSLPTAPQGISFVPFNTPQFVPPPPPPPPPPFHGWTPATKNIETWSTISNVNGLWIPAIKTPEGWTNE